jgi:hypothetical protein
MPQEAVPPPGSKITLAQAKAVIATQMFSSAETDKLLHIVKALLPNEMEWWKECKSNWTAIMMMPTNPLFKSKFTCLADTKKPTVTEDPGMPP